MFDDFDCTITIEELYPYDPFDEDDDGYYDYEY